MEEKKPRIKILVACHKADPNIRQDDIYMPIQVGKALHPELDLGFQCDNTGDNISEKNASYCELTALYWAWKNLKDVDYIGLCHYRRYFDIKNSEIQRYVKKYKTISIHPLILPHNVFTELSLWTSYENVVIFLDTIICLYPEYKQDIMTYYFLSNRFSQCNMFIMNRGIFDNYCQFVFSILANVESKIKKSDYIRQQRVFGYLSETLLGLFLWHNNIKNVTTDMNSELQSSRFKVVLNNIRFNIAFKLSTTYGRLGKFPINTSIINSLKQDNISIENF